MISQDLTESQRILNELKDSHEYNRGLIESNIDALMTTDPLGIISDVNLQMVRADRLFARMSSSVRPSSSTSPIRAAPKTESGWCCAEDRVTNYELIVRSRKTAPKPSSLTTRSTFRDVGRKAAGRVRRRARYHRAKEVLRKQLRRIADLHPRPDRGLG